METIILQSTYVTLTQAVVHASGCSTLQPGLVELFAPAPAVPFKKRYFFLRDIGGLLYKVTRDMIV